MFKNLRERRRINREFCEISSHLADIDNNSNMLGPRDYHLSEADSEFTPPQLQSTKLHWRVIVAILAAVFMMCFPVAIRIFDLPYNWVFYTTELAISLIFAIALLFSLKSGRPLDSDDTGAML